MTAKNRVVRVITRMNIGGPTRQAILLSKELNDEFPTRLVAGHPLPGEGELLDPDLEITRVPLVRPMRPHLDALAFKAIRRLIKSDRPQIVHTHQAKAGSITRLAGATVSVPPRSVHTFHGHVLEGYFRPAVESTFVKIERALARRTDVLIAISEEIKEELLELRIGRPSQYRVIPLGFDLSSFLAVKGPSGILRAHLGLDRDAPLVGILGRLAPIKDHEMLLRAIAGLDAVHLAILGDGELRNRLEVLTAELGITSRVHFVGWRLDVAEVVSDMDVVALSSRNEGTPVSLIEAHAAGKPAVATDVGGTRAVVEDGITGFLVPRGDVARMGESLRRLLDDAALRRRFGEAGRARARGFGRERLIDSIGSLYRELSAPNRRGTVS